MFEPLEKQSIDERERCILHFWQQQHIFARSVDAPKEEVATQRSEFLFFDGPPFATGLPHYGHLLAGIIKDVIPRYKTMCGFRVQRRFGWDCHGLPVEAEAEKQCGLSGAASIEAFGIAKFNELCREIVVRHDQKWEEVCARIGRWVDFDSAWHTMDTSYMESVWWVFKQLHDRDYIYRGYKVLPFSWKLGTPLSNFEAGENYQEVDDPSLIVKFPLKGEFGTFFLAWTTTPWTLPANMALAVRDQVEYVKVRDFNSSALYILARNAVDRIFRDRPCEIVANLTAKDLEGYAYEPLFPFFADRAHQGAFRVISDSFVSLDEGTGIVHTAPAFGESDFYACRKHAIPLVCPIDENGHFTQEVETYSGMHFQVANARIIEGLQKRDLLFSKGVLRHRYPMCWRTDTPLIYRATKTWFVAVETLKDAMLKHNSAISWVPEHIGKGRFGNWLENSRDWAISRNRYWGTPIPIWEGDRGGSIAIESKEHLETLTGVKLEDLHRHTIDGLTFDVDKETYRRIPEVFDCWFESGAMPYAHRHYPFENKEGFEREFPADFIAEGLDQTRGWFYTLHVLATALFDRPAFKNAIVNGIVLAENGAKMSKRLRNYPDPEAVLTRYGADATRLYMLQSGAVRGETLQFSESGVESMLRRVLIPWRNAYAFFSTYARIYRWAPHEALDVRALPTSRPDHILDRWITSRLGALIASSAHALDHYALSEVVGPFIEFVDDLTNWYIRRNRRRFWQDCDTVDRRQAFQTLYSVLFVLCHLAAPLTPFIADDLFRRLRLDEAPDSVHLSAFPQNGAHLFDEDLEMGMRVLMQISALGHSLRKERRLRVRQPLGQISIYCPRTKAVSFIVEHSGILEDELNVKKVVLLKSDVEPSKLTAKPNFRILGKKWTEALPEIKTAIAHLDQSSLMQLKNGHSIELSIETRDLKSIPLLPDEVVIAEELSEVAGSVSARDGDLVVILDTVLTPSLVEEGIVREIINKLNTLRRDLEFEVEDRIELKIEASSEIERIFHAHSEYICAETLITRFSFEGMPKGDHVAQWSLEGLACSMTIAKAPSGE